MSFAKSPRFKKRQTLVTPSPATYNIPTTFKERSQNAVAWLKSYHHSKCDVDLSETLRAPDVTVVKSHNETLCKSDRVPFQENKRNKNQENNAKTKRGLTVPKAPSFMSRPSLCHHNCTEKHTEESAFDRSNFNRKSTNRMSIRATKRIGDKPADAEQPQLKKQNLENHSEDAKPTNNSQTGTVRKRFLKRDGNTKKTGSKLFSKNTTFAQNAQNTLITSSKDQQTKYDQLSIEIPTSSNSKDLTLEDPSLEHQYLLKEIICDIEKMNIEKVKDSESNCWPSDDYVEDASNSDKELMCRTTHEFRLAYNSTPSSTSSENIVQQSSVSTRYPHHKILNEVIANTTKKFRYEIENAAKAQKMRSVKTSDLGSDGEFLQSDDYLDDEYDSYMQNMTLDRLRELQDRDLSEMMKSLLGVYMNQLNDGGEPKNSEKIVSSKVIHKKAKKVESNIRKNMTKFFRRNKGRATDEKHIREAVENIVRPEIEQLQCVFEKQIHKKTEEKVDQLISTLATIVNKADESVEVRCQLTAGSLIQKLEKMVKT